jgi:hypothetical protein
MLLKYNVSPLNKDELEALYDELWEDMEVYESKHKGATCKLNIKEGIIEVKILDIEERVN